jgi:metal-sulfur cluster biosynthetic enzyme
MPQSDRTAEILAALRPVTDPELDESVVELGFIGEISIEGDRVRISFRLPTFWCAANFAFVMAEDMREAVHSLDWLEGVEINLVDHFAADRINAGIAQRMGFGETFGPEAAGELTALRESFRRKAYLGRMSALIERLRERSRSAVEIVSTRIGDLEVARDDPGLDRAIARFLELRAVYGGCAERGEAAFRTPEGEAIAADRLSVYLRDIRMARRSAEANGEMCRMLLKARYDGASAPDELRSPAICRSPPLPARASRRATGG